MVAVEHNIHLNLKFKDVIIRFLFSECSRCNYLGDQSETIIYYQYTLKFARLFMYTLQLCSLNKHMHDNVFRLVKMCLMPGSVPVPVMLPP